MNVILACSLIVSVLGKQGFGPGDQDWGFVEIRSRAKMFWWLYKTTANVEDIADVPLVIWLQGGPGASSTGYGNFVEMGPLDVDLEPRNSTWVKNYNVLFVDNPVGTGFSYVDSAENFATTNKQIADDFLVFMQRFYENLPEFRNTPLYIFSESYGGKMAAEIALVLDKAIKDGFLDANLKGVGIGDAWISPIDSTLTWAPYLYNLGLIDKNGYEEVHKAATEVKKALENGQYSEATRWWGYTENAIASATYNVDFYNVISKISYGNKVKLYKPSSIGDGDSYKLEVIMNSQVKQALNINTTWGLQGGTVFKALNEDFMKPVVDIVSSLLDETDINIAVYNGQFDLIVDIPGTVKWVDELNWHGSLQWKDADREPIVVDGIIEGYVKKVGKLAFYWVNRAGHMVPADNTAAMDYILQDIVKGYDIRQ